MQYIEITGLSRISSRSPNRPVNSIDNQRNGDNLAYLRVGPQRGSMGLNFKLICGTEEDAQKMEERINLKLPVMAFEFSFDNPDNPGREFRMKPYFKYQKCQGMVDFKSLNWVSHAPFDNRHVKVIAIDGVCVDCEFVCAISVKLNTTSRIRLVLNTWSSDLKCQMYTALSDNYMVTNQNVTNVITKSRGRGESRKRRRVVNDDDTDESDEEFLNLMATTMEESSRMSRTQLPVISRLGS